ncbi:MAG: hypothetical protein ACFFG0_12230 [Candidatus Thorarchaeota archaeon]
MMSKKLPKIHRINVRLTDDQYFWYVNQATKRILGLSEFIREIPKIINELNNSLDEKDNKIIDLENENIKLRAKIFNLEKKSSDKKNIGTLDDVKEYLVK